MDNQTVHGGAGAAEVSNKQNKIKEHHDFHYHWCALRHDGDTCDCGYVKPLSKLERELAALRAQLAEAEADAERLATELDGALSQDGSCIPTQSEALAAHTARKEGKK